MKLQELLIEDMKEDFATIVRRDCSQFLTKVKGNGYLQRGMYDVVVTGKEVPAPWGGTVTMFEKTVRTDRRPSNIDHDTSEIIDEWFDKKFGIKARSGTVFCFGADVDFDTLEHYGDRYFIFPIGEFKFVWSPNVADLYNELDYNDVEDEDLEKWLKKQSYTSKNFGDAVDSENEIMIQCQKYYAVRVNEDDEDSMIDWIKRQPK